MSELRHDRRESTQFVTPLFVRRKIAANGETDELSLGPSAVFVCRWLVILILGGLMVLKGGNIWTFLRFLLGFYP
jgi:hypothetical protein